MRVTDLKPLVCLFAVGLVGCDSGRIERLEKQNQEILDRLKAQEAAQTLEVEAKCAQDARVFFSENYTQTIGPETYQNHYNKSLKKCFVWVSGQTFINQNDEWSSFEDLADVHGGIKLLGQFHENHSPAPSEPYNSNVVSACSVAGTRCSTQDDFDRLIKPYMTN